MTPMTPPKVIRDPDQLRELLPSTLDQVVADELRSLVAETGALFSGNFELLNGSYSCFFLRFGQLAWHSSALERIADHLHAKVEATASQRPRCIRCCETASFALGKALAERFDAQLTVVKANERRRPTTVIRHGTSDVSLPTLVVTDVVTTGNSVDTLINPLEAPVGVAAFAAIAPNSPQLLKSKWSVPLSYLLSGGWEVHDTPTGAGGVMVADEFN